MRDVIEFLEELGKNADLRLDLVDFESLLTNDDFDPEVKKAILEKDSKALELLLNARSKIVCMIVPAKEDEDDDDKDDDDNSKEDKQTEQRIQAC
jgi:hypothetical protein